MSKIAKWRLLTEEQFAQMVAESRSIQDLAQRIGYVKTGGGTQETLKKVIAERGLDTSHFIQTVWNKGLHDYSLFQNGSVRKNGRTTLEALIDIKGRQCECCKLTTWNDQPINLEIHHIDGDHYNNELTNLQLLCPNCHSYTENYCGKSNTGKKKITDEELIEALNNASSIAQALRFVGLSLGSGNYHRANELIVKYQITKFLN